MSQIGGNCPTVEQKAGKAPQRSGKRLGACATITAGLLDHEIRDVLGTERFQSEGLSAKVSPEKLPYRVEVILHGRWRQGTLLE